MMRTTTLCLFTLAILACNPDKGESDTDGSAAGSCADYCAKLDECGDPQAAECLEGCPLGVARYEYAGKACGALYGESLACRTAATCEELANDEGLCEHKLEALIVDACTTDLCDRYADRLIECNSIPADGKVFTGFECTMALSEARVEISAACGDAAEASIACVLKLECGEIQSSESCAAEAMAKDMVCE